MRFFACLVTRNTNLNPKPLYLKFNAIKFQQDSSYLQPVEPHADLLEMTSAVERLADRCVFHLKIHKLFKASLLPPSKPRLLVRSLSLSMSMPPDLSESASESVSLSFGIRAWSMLLRLFDRGRNVCAQTTMHTTTQVDSHVVDGARSLVK